MKSNLLLASLSALAGTALMPNLPEPRKPKVKTQADLDAIEKANQKRLRKQAKRAAK